MSIFTCQRSLISPWTFFHKSSTFLLSTQHSARNYSKYLKQDQESQRSETFTRSSYLNFYGEYLQNIFTASSSHCLPSRGIYLGESRISQIHTSTLSPLPLPLPWTIPSASCVFDDQRRILLLHLDTIEASPFHHLLHFRLRVSLIL